MRSFLEAVEHRRSVYTIAPESPVPDAEITKMIERLVLAVPSAYNSQSARVVLLFGASHTKLWNIVMATLRAHVPPEKFGPTEEKITGFANGYATVLYFDDTAVTESFEEQFPRYRENFRPWAEQANGMLQFAVWTALEDAGFGANLQHYNPIIDDEVKQTFSIPENWRLIAQMPFGKPTAAALSVEKIPAADRVRVVQR
ncbi:MAG: nitroreductase family protein [Methanocalculaceae archaeon]|jgi:predicted oxidoreductase (fatty acid repression mutant protein)|nr:nitroreductase family protein [Methanocalculaceae archaeon]